MNARTTTYRILDAVRSFSSPLKVITVGAIAYKRDYLTVSPVVNTLAIVEGSLDIVQAASENWATMNYKQRTTIIVIAAAGSAAAVGSIWLLASGYNALLVSVLTAAGVSGWKVGSNSARFLFKNGQDENNYIPISNIVLGDSDEEGNELNPNNRPNNA